MTPKQILDVLELHWDEIPRRIVSCLLEERPSLYMRAAWAASGFSQHADIRYGRASMRRSPFFYFFEIALVSSQSKSPIGGVLHISAKGKSFAMISLNDELAIALYKNGRTLILVEKGLEIVSLSRWRWRRTLLSRGDVPLGMMSIPFWEWNPSSCVLGNAKVEFGGWRAGGEIMRMVDKEEFDQLDAMDKNAIICATICKTYPGQDNFGAG